MASLNDTVFGILKADTRVNQDALERLVDLASRDPVLNAYLAQAQTNGGVKFRLAEGTELDDAKAAAFFDPDTTGKYNKNSMVVVLNPAWLVGENAGFATLNRYLLRSDIALMSHELDHYTRVDKFKALEPLTDPANCVGYTMEQRAQLFQTYATGMMKVEVMGWYASLKTAQWELTGDVNGKLTDFQLIGVTPVEAGLYAIERRGIEQGLQGKELENYIAENGAPILSSNRSYWGRYEDAMKGVTQWAGADGTLQAVDTAAIRRSINYSLTSANDIIDWRNYVTADGLDQTEVIFRNGTLRLISRDQDGNVTGASEIQNTSEGTKSTTYFADGRITAETKDNAGRILSTSVIQTYEDGSTAETTTYPNGTSTRINTNADDLIVSRTDTVPTTTGSVSTTHFYQLGTTVRLEQDANGNLLQRTVTVASPTGPAEITIFDGAGNEIGRGTLTTYAGSTSETINYTDGRIIRTNTDGRNTVITIADSSNSQVNLTALFQNGQFAGLTTLNGIPVSQGLNDLFSAALSDRGIDNPTPDDLSRLPLDLGENAFSRETAIRDAFAAVEGSATPTYDLAGNRTLRTQTEADLQNFTNGLGTLSDALALLRAVQSGEPLPVVASGLRLANDVSILGGTPNFELSGTANVASGVVSLINLGSALEEGDALAALTAGAQVVTFGATAYANFAGETLGKALSDGTFGAAGGAIGTISNALPYLSIINSLAHGDEIGAIIAAAAMIPGYGQVAALVLTIVRAIVGGDDIPDPWGTGKFVWQGNGITYYADGQTGGEQAVGGVAQGVLATLNALIEQAGAQNPGSALGLIPNRMPTLGYDMDGYRYTDIDPLTGAEQHPELRFDTTGRPYNAEPGSPESYQSIVEGIVYSALARGAIAPQWEVNTAKMQTDAGDPKAGLTEEERAARDGKLAAPITGSTQTFRPVVLDLDGDGFETTKKADGVAFDVDDSGYLKQTAWVKGDDALLVLDRNYNGTFDSGRELFSNGAVALSQRGVAGMKWVDANYDGKLTSADPVWNELKIWRDRNQDGVQNEGEVLGLTAQGITELNYAMGTFTQNGTKKQLGSPDLEADSEGSRVSEVKEGILIQSSGDGNISLVVTRVDDRTTVEANRDHITGYEDIEIIVSPTDLLANDAVGGASASELSIVGVTNFRHGKGFIAANGLVHFIPQADYVGDDAGFDYVVRAANDGRWAWVA